MKGVLQSAMRRFAHIAVKSWAASFLGAGVRRFRTRPWQPETMMRMTSLCRKLFPVTLCSLRAAFVTRFRLVSAQTIGIIIPELFPARGPESGGGGLQVVTLTEVRAAAPASLAGNNILNQTRGPST